MKKICFILMVLILLLVFAGCDPYATFDYYPFDRADKWYCAEIDCEIVFPADATTATSFVWKEKTYDGTVGIMVDYIDFWVDEDGDGSLEKVLSGYW